MIALLLGSTLVAFAPLVPPLEERIETRGRELVEERAALSVVIGVLADGRRSVCGFGRVSLDDDAVPDGDTLFEIGSITKTFTGLLLADAVERGRTRLDDPIGAHLPESVVLAASASPSVDSAGAELLKSLRAE